MASLLRARLAVEVGLLYPRLRWLLLRRGLGGALERLRGPLKGGSAENVGETPPVLAAAVDRMLGGRRARRPLPALLLIGLLARRGRNAALVLGAKPDPGFPMRAWVECEGEALLVHGTAGYRELLRV